VGLDSRRRLACRGHSVPLVLGRDRLFTPESRLFGASTLVPHQVPWGQILAAAVVATAPVAAIVLVAQRRIIAGLTSGAVKG